MNELEIAACMHRLAELSRGDTELPDPALIWWEAQLLKQRDARARAMRPLVIAEWASIAASAAAAAVLTVSNWPGIRDMLRQVFGG